MIPGEEKSLYQLARKSFTPIEALGASVPKHAVVAMDGDKIVGAMFLKIFGGKAEPKTGYLDLGFIIKEYRGKGIGGKLYPAAVEWLENAGCPVVSAMVKDDNVASWGLLEKQGFMRPGFIDFFRIFGVISGLLLWLKTIYCVACGMNFWTNRRVPPKHTALEMLTFFAVNMVLVCLGQGIRILWGGIWLWHEVLAALLILTLHIGSGWMGTRLSRRSWRFEVVRGGWLINIPLITLLNTFFPILGRWYPAAYDKSPDLKKAMGLEAVAGWIAMLVIYCLGALVFAGNPLWASLSANASIFLVFHVIAVYPFEYFGGKRVWDWNRGVFIACAVATCLSLFLI